MCKASKTASARGSARSACCATFRSCCAVKTSDSSLSPSKGETAMIDPSLFLRRAILADAIFSGLSAMLLTAGAGLLAPLLDLPEMLLRETGLFLVAYTAFVGWLGLR